MPAWPCSHRQTSTMVEPPRSWRSGRSSCSRRTLRIRNVSCKASRCRRNRQAPSGSTSQLRQHPWRNLNAHLYSLLPTQRIGQRWRATRALLSVNGVALGRVTHPAQTHTIPATLFQKAINSWVVHGERSDCSATSPSTFCVLPNSLSQVVSKLLTHTGGAPMSPAVHGGGLVLPESLFTVPFGRQDGKRRCDVIIQGALVALDHEHIVATPLTNLPRLLDRGMQCPMCL